MFIIIFLIGLLFINSGSAFILAYNKINGTHEYTSAEAVFGPGIIEGGILGVLAVAEPLEGCTKMKQSPYPPSGGEHNVSVMTFALIQRGTCDFAIKVKNAQLAGYYGAIVYNSKSDMVFRMNSELPNIANSVRIPSLFIGLTSAQELNSSFLYTKPGEPYIRLLEGSFDPIQYYLIPFIIVISVCFVSLLTFMLVKCVRDLRRTRRSRLSQRRLKELPVKKFQKGDEYDVCAICLDEYDENDKLRILPCKHAYHCKCVDPWLTSSKRVCPLCKQRVLSDDESSDDSDNESNENTPLVSSSTASSPNAASWATGFAHQNPIMRALRRNWARRTSFSDTDSPDTTDTEDEPLLSHQQQPLVTHVSYQDATLLPLDDTQQQYTPHEAEPCCSYSNQYKQDDQLQYAQVYIDETNRVSNASITVLSDLDHGNSPPLSQCSSVSGDYESLTESNNHGGRSESDFVTSDEHFKSAVSDDDDDDIVVLTHGSHQSNAEEV